MNVVDINSSDKEPLCVHEQLCHSCAVVSLIAQFGDAWYQVNV